MMTVAKLIAELQKANPDAEVFVYSDAEDCFVPVTSISGTPDDPLTEHQRREIGTENAVVI